MTPNEPIRRGDPPTHDPPGSDRDDRPSIAHPVRGRRRQQVINLCLGAWLLANLLFVFWPNISNLVQTTYRTHQRNRSAAPFTVCEIGTWPLREGFVSSKIPYGFYAAEGSSDSPLPLVVVLHGSGHRGSDGLLHLRTAAGFLASPAFQEAHPCHVVAPQCPPDNGWSQPGFIDFVTTVSHLIDRIERDHPIDRQRIYLMGHSMGAYGCFHFAAARPDLFAAALPVAGGGSIDKAAAYESTPVWAVHGTADDMVPDRSSQEMVDAINEAGGTATLTLLPGVDHDSWRFIQQTPNPYLDWLFSQKKSSSIPSTEARR